MRGVIALFPGMIFTYYYLKLTPPIKNYLLLELFLLRLFILRGILQ